VLLAWASMAAQARTREVSCAQGAEGPTTKGERGVVGLLLEEEEEGQGAPCHGWPRGGAGLRAMGGREPSSLRWGRRGGRHGWPVSLLAAVGKKGAMDKSWRRLLQGLGQRPSREVEAP
jgi:hypothetical protein